MNRTSLKIAACRGVKYLGIASLIAAASMVYNRGPEPTEIYNRIEVMSERNEKIKGELRSYNFFPQKHSLTEEEIQSRINEMDTLSNEYSDLVSRPEVKAHRIVLKSSLLTLFGLGAFEFGRLLEKEVRGEN